MTHPDLTWSLPETSTEIKYLSPVGKSDHILMEIETSNDAVEKWNGECRNKRQLC